VVNADVLDAALETSTRANEALFEGDKIPLLTSLIKRGKIRWQPERFKDGEHFDLATQAGPRGWGDCDDLAPWLAAELRATGRDPGAAAVAKKSGRNKWHAVVRASDGRILDPSKWAGMHGGESSIVGAVQTSMARPGGGALGIRGYSGSVAARCDLPVEGSDLFISGVCLDDDMESAVSGALDAALCCGELSGAVEPTAALRAWCLRHLMSGMAPDVLADELAASELIPEDWRLDGADESDIGFLPALAALAPSVMPMASGLLSSVMPGGGGKAKGGGAAPAGPASPPAMAAATPGGGAPITVTPYSSSPGNPIIVRF